jgi:pimeloyl-ACP methyl ester carboxylesterase
MTPERREELVRLDLAPGAWLQGQWSYTMPGREPAVVFVHGFCSVRYGEKSQALEAACARRGWTFAAFDFRGHGESSGSIRDLRGSSLLADLEAVADFLARCGVRRIALVGSSMGAWVAAWYALRHPAQVAACAFIAPGFHFPTARWERLSAPEQQAWKEQGFLRIRNQWIETELGYALVEEAGQFPLESLARGYQTPTLIFQGMQDDVVPAARTLAFVEQAAFPHIELRIYKDGDHRLVDRKDPLAEAACNFFAPWVGLGPRGSPPEIP